jgi:hypothetical protein
MRTVTWEEDSGTASGKAHVRLGEATCDHFGVATGDTVFLATELPPMAGNRLVPTASRGSSMSGSRAIPARTHPHATRRSAERSRARRRLVT